MPHIIRTLALAVMVLAIAGCGSARTAAPTSSTAAEPTIAQPPIATGTPSGTTDPGSRYLETADPFGAIAVETDPLAEIGVPVTPPALAPTSAPEPVPAPVVAPVADDDGPPAGPAPRPFGPANGQGGPREYRAPAPPPPPPLDPNRWTTREER